MLHALSKAKRRARGAPRRACGVGTGVLQPGCSTYRCVLITVEVTSLLLFTRYSTQ